MKKLLIYTIIILMVLLVTVAPLLLQPYNSSDVRRFAKDWPTTTATIYKIHPERGNLFKRSYKFSYCVDENNLVNMEIPERHTSVFSRKPDGTQVEIHYDPEHPNKIVVAQEDANVIYNRTPDLIFVGIGIGVLIGVFVVVKKKKDD